MRKTLIWGLFLILILTVSGSLVLAEDVERGGIVRVTEGRQGVLIKNFNPFSPNPLQTTFGFFYETLVLDNTHTGEVGPWLAKDWEWSDDLRSLTFHLEENVYWNDGEKFTAEDVIFTLDLGREDPALDRSGIWEQGLETVEALDDYKVRFTFDEANTPIITVIANIYIVPQHIWKDVEDPSEWTDNVDPVGTGPFIFEEGSFREFSYRFERNPNYWQMGADGKPLPYIDGVEQIGATSNDHAAMKIINGEVDWGGYFIPNIDETFVAANPDHHHYWLPEGNIVYLAANNAREPFDNPNVRKAVAMALDPEEIVTIMASGAIPADISSVKTAFLDWVTDEARAQYDPGFDPQAARDLLQEEGFSPNDDGIMTRDGEEMAFDLYVPTGWTDWITGAEVVSEQLREIGIRARVTQRAWPSPFMDNLRTGEYDISISYATSGSSPFFQFDNILHSRHYAPLGEAAPTHSQVRYSNEVVDQALDSYRTTPDYEEEERLALMEQVTTEFLRDLPYIPLFFNPVWFQYNTTNFTGWPNEDDPYVAPHFAGMGKMLIYLNLQPVN